MESEPKDYDEVPYDSYRIPWEALLYLTAVGVGLGLLLRWLFP
jgi:hypothetical protein